jgi:hypothetical protein
MRLASSPAQKESATPKKVVAGMREVVAAHREPRLWTFGEGLKRAPSQKELALILRVTTRHLRRWENAEAASDRRCSRPYSHADLWHLYQRRGGKGWDRPEAARLGLVGIFECFDQMTPGNTPAQPQEERSVLAGLMLRSIAVDEQDGAPATGAFPRAFGAGLAIAAKMQLRMIVDCDQAREILVKAFFEAALIAEATRVPKSSNFDSLSPISA